MPERSAIFQIKYTQHAYLSVIWILFAFVAKPLNAQTEIAPQTSIIAPLAEHSLLLDITRAGNRFIAVGERGHVLLSDNQGHSWRQVRVPTQALLTAVFFRDARHGWIVGHDAVILRSVDAGETWQLQHFAPELEKPLFAIWLDAQNGLAVGAYGYALRTDDGGLTWQTTRIAAEDELHLNAIHQTAAGDLYIAAEAGHVYRSRDRGQTWQSLPSPYEGSFFGVFSRAERLWIYGLRGHVFTSSDQGESWQELAVDTQALLTHAILLPDERLLITGMEGSLLIGNGNGFYAHRLPDRLAIAAAALTDDGALLAVGEAGVRKLLRREYMSEMFLLPHEIIFLLRQGRN